MAPLKGFWGYIMGHGRTWSFGIRLRVVECFTYDNEAPKKDQHLAQVYEP